jgi:hypothetical protein
MQNELATFFGVSVFKNLSIFIFPQTECLDRLKKLHKILPQETHMGIIACAPHFGVGCR